MKIISAFIRELIDQKKTTKLPERELSGYENNAKAHIDSSEIPLLMGEIAFENGDYAMAAYWYTESAELGNAIAQGKLGIMYYQGMGISQDYVQAVFWFKKSAEQGNAMSQAILGARFYKGDVVSQDYAQAAYWYRKSAEQGDAKSQAALGGMYYDGEGVSKNYEMAYFWLLLASVDGNEGIMGLRDFVEKELSPLQRAKTQEAASKWTPKKSE